MSGKIIYHSRTSSSQSLKDRKIKFSSIGPNSVTGVCESKFILSSNSGLKKRSKLPMYSDALRPAVLQRTPHTKTLSLTAIKHLSSSQESRIGSANIIEQINESNGMKTPRKNNHLWILEDSNISNHHFSTKELQSLRSSADPKYKPTQIAVTKFNRHLFNSDIAKPRVGTAQRSNNNIFSSIGNESKISSKIDPKQFRFSRICKQLDLDFEKQIDKIKVNLKRNGEDKLKAISGGLIQKREELLRGGPMMPHGSTYVEIFQDRIDYLSEKLKEPQRDLYEEKMGNIQKFCVPEKFDSAYQKNLEAYHNLYLSCMKRKKEPVLTLLLKKNGQDEKMNNDMNVYVKYNPELKSKNGLTDRGF